MVGNQSNNSELILRCTGRVFKIPLDTKTVTGLMHDLLFWHSLSGFSVRAEVEFKDSTGKKAGLTSLDGLYIHPSGTNLISVGALGVFAASSNDEWKTARIVDKNVPTLTGTTTGAFHDGKLDVLHG